PQAVVMTRWLTNKEAAEHCRISVDTLMRHVNAGRLPYVDVSAVGDKRRTRIFDVDDLDALLAARKVTGPPTQTGQTQEEPHA
ncbi:MAG: helix-turn-helix domain-containing protein, partial [Nocardioides sp.]